jgi:hypothetical protein
MFRVASTYRAESGPSKNPADEGNSVCEGRASRPKQVFTIRHSGVGVLRSGMRFKLDEPPDAVVMNGDAS